MVVTAKETTSALRRVVYPVLKGSGFRDWTSRRAWRRQDGRIDHIEFRSFNSHDAEKYDCTPASVSVWLGVHPEFFSFRSDVKLGAQGKRPAEWEMAIRGELAPSVGLAQANPLRIWIIRSENDARDAAEDIREQLRNYGLDWLGAPLKPEGLLKRLLDDDELNIERAANGAHLWIDAGAKESPNRNIRIAELAAELGDYGIAAQRFERARWATNFKTGAKALWASPKIDAELLSLSKRYADRLGK